MSTDTKITYVNKSNDQDDPTVLVFAKPTQSSLAAEATAWQVIKNIGYNSWHKFTYTRATSIQVLWDNERSGTFPIEVTKGKSYTFQPKRGGFFLEESGVSNAPDEFDIINEVSVSNGISVVALKDGNPILTRSSVAKGEKVEFVFHPKLYFGLSSEYHVGDSITTAVMSDEFKEISLEGLQSLTVTLVGNAENGYTFEVSDQVPA